MTVNHVKVNDKTGEVEITPTRPATVQDMEKMLGEQSNVPTEERDKLWNEVQAMSDEELKKAIAEEPTEIAEGNKAAKPAKAVAFDPMAAAVDKLSPDDMLKLVDLAMKVKNDPKFNPVPEIPKDIFNMIRMQGKMAGWNNAQIASYAKFMITELVDEMNFEKDLNIAELEDAMGASQAMLNGSLVFVSQPWELKKYYEEKLVKDAKENPEYSDIQRNVLLGISKAYTDSYTLSRQMELLKDDTFIAKIPKLLKEKHFKRMCEDFDYTISKTQVQRTSVLEIMKLMPEILKVGEAKTAIFIITLCELTKKATPRDTEASMFMFSSVYNIRALACSSYLTDNNVLKEEEGFDFVTERIGYLKAFFELLEKRNNEFTNIA